MLNHQQQLLINASQKSIPLEVSLELTHHCNFRCQHCYIPDFTVPNLVTTERYITLLDELAAMGTMFLTLTGGELFLRKDWLEIAQAARDRGFVLRLFSNGALISDQVADAMAALPAAAEISLYAMDAEVFDEITQRPGSFEKTMAGIRRLRERGIEILLKIPLMTLNVGQVDAVQAFAQEIGAGCLVSPTILAKKNGAKDTLPLRVPLKELPVAAGGPFSGCQVPVEHPLDPRIDGPQCAAASRYCNITASGDVMACNVLPGSDRNINEHSFVDIWQSSPWLKQIRAIRRKDLKTCRTCSRVSFCGRCHAQAMVEDGDLYGPSSYAQERADLWEAMMEDKAIHV